MQNAILLNGCLLVFAGLFAVNLFQVLNNKISKHLLKLDALVYLGVFLGVILLKSQGVQEINLSLFDLYRQIIEYPSSVILNVVLFVPLGIGLAYYAKGLVKASCIALMLVLFLELAQYWPSLGITDIVDVCVNMTGFFVGYALVEAMRGQGLCLVDGAPNHVSFCVSPEKLNHPAPARQGGITSKCAICGLAVGAAAFLFIAGFLVYDYEPYVAPDPYATEHKLTQRCSLRSLPIRGWPFFTFNLDFVATFYV